MAQTEEDIWMEVYYNQFTEDQDPENGLSRDQAGLALMEMGQNPTLMQLGELWQLKEKETGISLQELKDFHKRLGDPKDNLKAALETAFDLNHDGRISKDEFINLLQATDVYGNEIGNVNPDDADSMEMINQLFGNEPDISIEDCVAKIQENKLHEAYEPANIDA